MSRMYGEMAVPAEVFDDLSRLMWQTGRRMHRRLFEEHSMRYSAGFQESETHSMAWDSVDGLDASPSVRLELDHEKRGTIGDDEQPIVQLDRSAARLHWDYPHEVEHLEGYTMRLGISTDLQTGSRTGVLRFSSQYTLSEQPVEHPVVQILLLQTARYMLELLEQTGEPL